MKALKEIRTRLHVSQRGLARRAEMSYKAIQLMERPGHDMRLSSLAKVTQALGLPVGGVSQAIQAFLLEERDSFRSASLRIIQDGFSSWKVHLFDSVDTFQRHPAVSLIASPPAPGLELRLQALVAGIVDTLADGAAIDRPWWTEAVGPLERPWFVSGMENLKATALAESPLHFRKRGVFVLGNFLERA